MKKVAVVGLGYVGLPLSLLADRKGHEVLGIDADQRKLTLLRDKKTPIDDGDLQEQVSKSSLRVTDDFKEVAEQDIVIICVPTPVDDAKLPDLTPLKTVTELVGKNLRKGTLVVVESTINPGVCDEVVIPLLEEVSGLKVGQDVFVAHCPERINPGDPRWSVANINRVVGGDSPESLKRALEFYTSIVDAQVKPMGSLKEAESVKIIENTFRDINIAFVNELAMSFAKMGINLENVIEGAATKPFGYMPFAPGCGVGGHCIPVDPYYLIERARGFGFNHRFLELARTINNSMPEYTVDLLEELLGQPGATVGVLGMSYKANVADMRESPALELVEILEARGYKVLRYEPFADDLSDVKDVTELLEKSDGIIVATGHKAFADLKPTAFAKAGVKAVVDGRNFYRDHADGFKTAGVAYCGIGIPATK